MPNRPQQIDFFFRPVTLPDGSPLGGGVVVVYAADARDAAGKRVFRRAPIHQDADGLVAFANSEIFFDSNGRPVASSGSPANVPVYGDGDYRLLFFADPADRLQNEENDPAVYAAYMALPTADRTETFHASHEIVNARHFGARGDANLDSPGSGTDDTGALQAAIDYCLGISAMLRPRVLFIPAGTYRITAPLRIMTPGADGVLPTQLNPCSLHIHGEKDLPRQVNPDTMIYSENTALPAIMIQAGIGVTLRHLGIYGVNAFDKNLKLGVGEPSFAFAALLDDSNYYYDWTMAGYPGLSGKCRDTTQSPCAAIVVDPFTAESSVLAGNQYPGFAAYYQLAGYSYSTSVRIDGCNIGRFPVGLMIAPTGVAANAENFVVEHTHFETCRVAVAIGQNQARGLNVLNCDVYLVHTAFDNRSYGAGIEGTPPNIRGLTVSQCKYLFNLDMGTTSISVEQVYAENLLAIGFLGPSARPDQFNVAFVGCDFNFVATHPMIDTHLYGYAMVSFSGCMFTISSATPPAHPPLSFANRGVIRFDNCRLNSGRVGPVGSPDWDWLSCAPAWGFNEPTLVSVNAVHHLDNFTDGGQTQDPRGSRVTYLRQEYPLIEGSLQDQSDLEITRGLMRQYLPPGAAIGPTPAPSGSPVYLRRVSGAMNRIAFPTNGEGWVPIYLSPPDTVYVTGLLNQVLLGDVVYIPYDPGAGWPIYLYAKASAGNPGNPVLMSQQVPVPKPEATFPVGAVIGSITSISSGKNNIEHAPRSLVDAINGPLGVFDAATGLRYLPGRQVWIQRFGRYHSATRGTWDGSAGGTNAITVTFPDPTPAPSLQAVWKRGDRITTDVVDGSGNPLIPPGTYVTGTLLGPPMRIQVSKVLTTSAADARLFDANVYRVLLSGE